MTDVNQKGKDFIEAGKLIPAGARIDLVSKLDKVCFVTYDTVESAFVTLNGYLIYLKDECYEEFKAKDCNMALLYHNNAYVGSFNCSLDDDDEFVLRPLKAHNCNFKIAAIGKKYVIEKDGYIIGTINPPDTL